MVFDWKVVPADEQEYKKAYFDTLQIANKSGVPLRSSKSELQINDWLKYEFRWFYLGHYRIVFAVIRKVHKKAQYPPEWFDYPKEREDELFVAKAKKILDQLSNQLFMQSAVETAAMMVNNANYYAGILAQIWTFLEEKNQNIVRLAVYEPSLRYAADAWIARGPAMISLEKGGVVVERIAITTVMPLMPLTWIMSLPFIAAGFIPIAWIMRYSLYFGTLLMMRVPPEAVDKSERIALELIYGFLYTMKDGVICDNVRVFPVSAEILKTSVYPAAEMHFFITEKGVFFEKPPKFEWLLQLPHYVPRMNEAELRNIGARDYLSMISILFGNI